MNKIPDKIPAVLFDRAAYCLKYLGNTMLNIEMEFGHRLDAERLRTAFRLALDAEPVLGCRFVFHPRRPHWKRLGDGERDNFQVMDDESEYGSALLEPVDISRGPQLRGVLLRRAKGDILLVKVAHEAADAGGAKEVLAVVSSIYNRLAADPGHVPEANVKGSRSLWQVMKRLPWRAWPRVFLNLLRETWSNMVPLRSLSFRVEEGGGGPFVYILRHVPAQRLSRLVEYGRARGAKINDMMLAALLRTAARLAGWKGESQLRLVMTVDLRRWYLPSGKGEAVCNLSAFEYPNLGTSLGKDFESTLARISEFTRRRKSNWMGMNMWFGLGPVCAMMSFRQLKKFVLGFFAWAAGSGNMPSGLTNLGPIDPGAATFDKQAKRAWMLTPPVRPPFFAFGISGYSGALTLSAGTSVSAAGLVEKFFDEMLSELPE